MRALFWFLLICTGLGPCYIFIFTLQNVRHARPNWDWIPEMWIPQYDYEVIWVAIGFTVASYISMNAVRARIARQTSIEFDRNQEDLKVDEGKNTIPCTKCGRQIGAHKDAATCPFCGTLNY